jgi:hypothetical protein
LILSLAYDKYECAALLFGDEKVTMMTSAVAVLGYNGGVYLLFWMDDVDNISPTLLA